MKINRSTLDSQKSVRNLLGIPLLVLVIPIIGKLFGGWNWDIGDFVVIGVLHLAATFVYEVASRFLRNYEIALAIAIILAVIYLWAELAVGIFTNWGS